MKQGEFTSLISPETGKSIKRAATERTPATRKNNPNRKRLELKKIQKVKDKRRSSKGPNYSQKEHGSIQRKKRPKNKKKSLADPKEKRADWNKIPTGQTNVDRNRTQIRGKIKGREIQPKQPTRGEKSCKSQIK
jgi:hypothetical protein